MVAIFYVVITSDYVFTEQYLLFKIKMDASVYLQFNQSTNQWIARSLTTNQKPCPVQNPGAKGSSCRLIFGDDLQSYWCARLLDIWLIITIVTFFFLFWLFLIKKIYIILMPHCASCHEQPRANF